MQHVGLTYAVCGSGYFLHQTNFCKQLSNIMLEPGRATQLETDLTDHELCQLVTSARFRRRPELTL